jgi:hypothetical protein
VPLKGACSSSGAENFDPVDVSLRFRQNRRQGGHLLDSKVFGTFPGWDACNRALQVVSRMNAGVFPDGKLNRSGAASDCLYQVFAKYSVLPMLYFTLLGGSLP